MNQFCEIIKKARENNGLFLRQVASKIEIDQAIISKFERGERIPTKKQVLKFANFYQLDQEQLIVAWLSDSLANQIQDDNLAEKVLQAVKEKINNTTFKKTDGI